MENFFFTILGHAIGPIVRRVVEGIEGKYRASKKWTKCTIRFSFTVAICSGCFFMAGFLLAKGNENYLGFIMVAFFAFVVLIWLLAILLRFFFLVCEFFDKTSDSLNDTASERGSNHAS